VSVSPQLGIAGLYNQIERIYQELDIHLRRMTKIQAELNDVRAKIQQMAGESS